MSIGATNSGTMGTNSVYLDVIRRLSRARSDVGESNFEALLKKIEELGTRTAAYSRFGMLPKLDADSFGEALTATSLNRSVAFQILQPYLESLEQRLDALRDVYQLVETFLNRANGFLRDKELRFDIHRGLRVVVPRERAELPLASLSSGERQLMLLLCNTVIARRRTGLFLIDEPEISLNVKWQRRLLRTMLELTDGSPVQFVVATHSIEMISPNRENLIRLQPDDE